jgi:hypothetical protein
MTPSLPENLFTASITLAKHPEAEDALSYFSLKLNAI